MARTFKVTHRNRFPHNINTKRNHVVYLLGLLWGLPLLISGIGHLTNPHRFLDSVFRYQIIPNDLVPYAASIFPATTTVVGLALVFGINLRAALFLSAMLYGCFGGAQLIQLLSSGKSIDCGCFVWIPHETSFGNVALLMAMAAIALVAACFARHNKNVPTNTQNFNHQAGTQ